MPLSGRLRATVFNKIRTEFVIVLAFAILLLQRTSATPQDAKSGASAKQVDWPAYGGGPADTRYSPLSQIDRNNVRDLQVAWRYDTGDKGILETSPIIVDGILYGATPTLKIFALNAATGQELWKFDSGIAGNQPERGVTYWMHGNDKRIFAGIMNFVYALDAGTGKPILEFGEDGRIDLRKDLGRDFRDQFVIMTSPGIVYKDLLIVGGREAETLPASPGDIRAYDAKTGKLRWSFHTIPHPGEFGYDTWPKDAWTHSGGANNWAGMAIDEKRGIVYVPTGSAAFDFYGADRLGNDLFANTLLALNAETGARIWHFQGVKHDLWDRDFPSPPSLVTVKRNGRTIDAIAQTTKHGYVFLFDRTNGNSLFPIEYHKFPPSTVPGELASETQPIPSKPVPFARQLLTEDMLTNRTPEGHQWAEEQFERFRSEGQFVPLSLGRDTVVFPGFDGGAEWGGSAVDPQTGVLFVNSNDLAWTGSLAETTFSVDSAGRALYLDQCSACHRDDLSGSPPDFPSLAGVGNRLPAELISSLIRQGRGRMPGFPALSANQVAALVEFLQGAAQRAPAGAPSGAVTKKYHFTGYRRFLDPDGYPAIAPPWGTLSAINLNTGEYQWKVPLGEYPALVAEGLRDTGSENYGGPIVTAGGLVFIAATIADNKIRAFDKDTGKLLWQSVLPFAATATPATYLVGGRQYVVIASGGGRTPKLPAGGVYVAFALPEQ